MSHEEQSGATDRVATPVTPPADGIVQAHPVVRSSPPTERGVILLEAPAPPPRAGSDQPPGEPPVLVGNPTLTSEPRQLSVDLERQPDSVVDGGEVGGLVIRAASLRGDDHRLYAEVRQDAFGIHAVPVPTGDAQPDPVLVACVADGVGSQPRSHLGAAAACRFLRQEIDPYLTAIIDPQQESELQQRCGQLMEQIASRLRHEAANHDVAAKALSTTLVAAVVGTGGAGQPRRAVFFAVGDSPAYILRRGGFLPTFDAGDDPDIASSATDALPTQVGQVTVRVADLYPSDMVLLCTDGLSNPLRAPAVSDQLASWWQDGPVPGLPAFLWQLSFRAQSYGDDRTAVCVWVR